MLILLFVLLFQLVDCLRIKCRIIGVSKTIDVFLSASSTIFFDENTVNDITVQLTNEARLPYNIKCIGEANLFGKKIQDGCYIDFVPFDQFTKDIQSENSIGTIGQVIDFSEKFGLQFFEEITSELKSLKVANVELKDELKDSNNMLSGKLTMLEKANTYLKVADVELKDELKESNNMLSGKVTILEKANTYLKEANTDLKGKVAMLEEADNSLFFINAERDICQVLDAVYASILKELQKSGNFKKIRTLSFLLKGKADMPDEEQRKVDEKIVGALSSLAKLHSQKQAAFYWRALLAVRRPRDFEYEYYLGDEVVQQAQQALADYLKYGALRNGPQRQKSGRLKVQKQANLRKLWRS